eukprot:tig00000789_g4110.t1
MPRLVEGAPVASRGYLDTTISTPPSATRELPLQSPLEGYGGGELPSASSIVDLENKPFAAVSPGDLAHLLRVRIGAALVIQRWWRRRKRLIELRFRRKLKLVARARRHSATLATSRTFAAARPSHCTDFLGQGYVADFFPVLEEWCAVGMSREGAPALDDLRVAQSIVYKNGVIAYWLYRDDKSGAVRLRKRNEAILPNIMAAFGEPVAGTDVCALYVALASDPKPGEEPVTVEFFDQRRLRLFLSGPKREDGLLQRYFPPLGESETTYRVTWSAGLFKVEQRTNLAKWSDPGTHRYRRCTTFDGPPHFSRLYELEHRHRVYKRIYSLTRRLVQAIEVTRVEWRPRYLVLNWKFDQRDRLHLLWCSTLRYANAETGASFCLQCGRQVVGNIAMYNKSIADRNLPFRKVTEADLRPPRPAAAAAPAPAASSRGRAGQGGGAGRGRAGRGGASEAGARRRRSRPPPPRPTSAHQSLAASPALRPARAPGGEPPPLKPASATRLEAARVAEGPEEEEEEEEEAGAHSARSAAERALFEGLLRHALGEEEGSEGSGAGAGAGGGLPAVLEFWEVFEEDADAVPGVLEALADGPEPRPGPPRSPPLPLLDAELRRAAPAAECAEGAEEAYEFEYAYGSGRGQEGEGEALFVEDAGQGEWEGDAVEGHDPGPGHAPRPASAAPWRARSALSPAPASPPASPPPPPPAPRPRTPRPALRFTARRPRREGARAGRGSGGRPRGPGARGGLEAAALAAPHPRGRAPLLPPRLRRRVGRPRPAAPPALARSPRHRPRPLRLRLGPRAGHGWGLRYSGLAGRGGGGGGAAGRGGGALAVDGLARGPAARGAAGPAAPAPPNFGARLLLPSSPAAPALRGPQRSRPRTASPPRVIGAPNSRAPLPPYVAAAPSAAATPLSGGYAYGSLSSLYAVPDLLSAAAGAGPPAGYDELSPPLSWPLAYLLAGASSPGPRRGGPSNPRVSRR